MFGNGRGRLLGIAVAGAASLAACDADHVHWAFVSNPGGPHEGGGIVIVVSSGGHHRAGLGSDVLAAPGSDDQGAVTVYLPHGGDFVALARQDGVELRSPVLAQPRLDLPGARVTLPDWPGAAAMHVQLPDSGLVHPAAQGPGRLTVAARGTLLVVESAAGLVILGAGPPEVLPPDAVLTATAAGDALAVLGPDGDLRALAPPPPPPGKRLQEDPARGTVRVLGPHGEPLVELPRQSIELQDPASGLFLVAELPQGLPREPGPTTFVMARDNRYLLRLRLP